LETVNEYKLENYQRVRALGEKDNLWLVKDSVTEKYFVMRRLPADSLRLCQILGQIRHPNIVEIFDVFTYGGFLYVIEEYLEWELLSDRMDKAVLSHRCALNVGKQLLGALSVLHEHHIVHRDIKPENIMIDRAGNVKLIDFDIARIFSKDKSSDTVAKGSRAYAPPEQFGFAQSDCRADIYSLGVTLNELATGKLPEEKLCAGRLGAIVRRCTEFDPKRRYQTAGQALSHISRLEKRSIFLYSGTGILVLLTAGMLLAGSYKHKPSLQPSPFALSAVIKDANLSSVPERDFLSPAPEKAFDSETEDIFARTEYEDRIISFDDSGWYPAVVMAEDESLEFREELGNGITAEVAAEKAEEKLFFTCMLQNGKSCELELIDDYSDIYKQQKNSGYADFENICPEYEILLDDFNQDGVTDFVITLAWRQRIETENVIYYFTEYSALWLLYFEENEMFCSEPVYFDGCSPRLDMDGLLLNTMDNEWYWFKDGKWNVL
jgi:Serine/threonine protein kinase